MKKITRPILIVLLFFFLGILPLQAATYEFDKAHSSIRFGVQHIYSTVYGQFDDYSGNIVFDPKKPTDAVFNIIIEVKSINTGIGKRDKHLRSAEFFDANKYPQITFVSSAAKHIEGTNYEISGTLTMKDVSKDIVLPLVFHGSKDHPMDKGKIVAGFDINIPLDRLAYRVGDGKFYKMGIVGKDIDTFVSLEMLTSQ